MKLVVNTGPIIALAKIGKLVLLKELAPEVFIPPTVYRELLAKFGAESEQIEQALTDFIRVTEVREIDRAVEIAIAGLDEGEKLAIALLSDMRDRGYWLSDQVIEVAKRLAGEED